MSQKSLFFILVLSLFTFSACSKKKSDETNTQAWYATYSVKSEGGQIVCEANYRVGTGSSTAFIELTGGDYVDCNGVSTVRADSLVGEVIYKAAVAPSTQVVITLHRRGEKDYAAIVGIPEAVVLNAPTEGQVLNKQQLVNVLWTSSSFSVDRMRLNLTFSEGSSNPSQSLTKYRTYFQAKEEGQFAIPATETPGGVGSASLTSDIPAVLQLVRSRAGAMPEGLEGQIVATRNTAINLIFR